MRRELISDYGENTNVILSCIVELVKCNVMELLSEKYTSEVEGFLMLTIYKIILSQ